MALMFRIRSFLCNYVFSDYLWKTAEVRQCLVFVVSYKHISNIEVFRGEKLEYQRSVEWMFRQKSEQCTAFLKRKYFETKTRATLSTSRRSCLQRDASLAAPFRGPRHIVRPGKRPPLRQRQLRVHARIRSPSSHENVYRTYSVRRIQIIEWQWSAHLHKNILLAFHK